MKEFTYTVEDPNGMHARPAGRLATFAKQFSSQIRIRSGEREADAKRLLSLMSLGAVHGSTLFFFVTGDDEDEAGTALEKFCREEWGQGKIE